MRYGGQAAPGEAGHCVESYHPGVLGYVSVLLSAGWVALLIATPLMPAWAGAVAYGLGSFICHQLPERSFHLAGFQLPVCARCLGIYIGVSSGVAYAWTRRRSNRARRRRHHRTQASSEVRWLAVVAAAPTVLTVALETAGAWYPSNSTRALAGLPLGILVGLVVMNALATINYDECVPLRPTVPKPPPRSI
jgi:uncharacterized membrane protein